MSFFFLFRENYRVYYEKRLAQLGRATGLYPVGHGSESRTVSFWFAQYT